MSTPAPVDLAAAPDSCAAWIARFLERRGIDRVFDRLRRGYSRWLKGSLNYLPVTATFAPLLGTP